VKASHEPRLRSDACVRPHAGAAETLRTACVDVLRDDAREPTHGCRGVWMWRVRERETLAELAVSGPRAGGSAANEDDTAMSVALAGGRRAQETTRSCTRPWWPEKGTLASRRMPSSAAPSSVQRVL